MSQGPTFAPGFRIHNGLGRCDPKCAFFTDTYACRLTKMKENVCPAWVREIQTYSSRTFHALAWILHIIGPITLSEDQLSQTPPNIRTEVDDERKTVTFSATEGASDGREEADQRDDRPHGDGSGEDVLGVGGHEPSTPEESSGGSEGGV